MNSLHVMTMRRMASRCGVGIVKCHAAMHRQTVDILCEIAYGGPCVRSRRYLRRRD